MEFSKNELRTIAYALNDRMSVMFRDAEAYKNNGNKVAQKDCLDEYRLAQSLLDRIKTQLKDE